MTVVTLAAGFWFFAAILGLAFGAVVSYSSRSLGLIQIALVVMIIAVVLFDFFLASYASRAWRYAGHASVICLLVAVACFLVTGFIPKRL